MYQRILVPLDGSKLAERSLAHAAQFGRIFGAVLVLLRVLDPSSFSEQQRELEPLNWQIRKAEADVYLQEIARDLHNQGVQVETVLLEGRTPENIIDYTHNQAIDLLILTTHGASGLSRWNTSSIFQKVVNKVYTDLLVIRAYHGHPSMDAADMHAAGIDAAGIDAAGMSMNAPGMYMEGEQPQEPSAAQTDGYDFPDQPIYHRILLPVDSSRRAECTFPAATALAQAMGSKLILGAILKQPDLPMPPPYPDEIRDLTERLMRLSQESVNNYLSELRTRLPGSAETRVMESDSVRHALHDLADQENADLVILCAHGQTGRINWPYGSVASNYIEYGSRPLLIIQDVPRSQVRPTQAEVAAEKYGRR